MDCRGSIPEVATVLVNGASNRASRLQESMPSATQGPLASSSVCSSTASRPFTPAGVAAPLSSTQPRARYVLESPVLRDGSQEDIERILEPALRAIVSGR